MLVVLPCVGLWGWYLLSDPAPRTEAEFVLPLVLTLVGILGTIGAAVACVILLAFRRRQLGRG